MNVRIVSIIAGVLATSLSYQYVFALWLFVQNGSFYPVNLLETVVLGIQVAKLIVILSVKRLRKTKFTNVLDIWAVEILAVPVLIGLSVSQGDALYVSWAGDIFLAWGAAVLLIFPVFAIYKITSMVLRDASLTTLLPSATSVFALLAFLISAMNQHNTSFVGLSGLARAIPYAVQAASASMPQEVSVAGALLYLSLILYSVTRLKDEIFNQLDSVLVFSLLGTVAALGWAFLAQATNNALFDFGIPSLVFASLVWLIARGK
jgi:hypothetical protein